MNSPEEKLANLGGPTPSVEKMTAIELEAMAQRFDRLGQLTPQELYRVETAICITDEFRQPAEAYRALARKCREHAGLLRKQN